MINARLDFLVSASCFSVFKRRPKPDGGRAQPNPQLKETISTAFAALCAAGSRMRSAAGIAPIATIRNIFMPDAELNGILSRRAAYVRAAGISGVGRHACAARVGRPIKTGTGKTRTM
jgi:hypothetical protein